MLDTSEEVLPSDYRELPGDGLPDNCPLCNASLDWEHDPSDPSVGFIGGWFTDCPVCRCRFERGESESEEVETHPPAETLDHFSARLREVWDWVDPDILEEMASAHAIAMGRLAKNLERHPIAAQAETTRALLEREEVRA